MALLIGSDAARAQEWTRFRGPNGAGQSDATTIPTEWADKDFNWKIDLPGIGHSSPVLWGDKIFLTSADVNNGTRLMFCVNAKDGKLLWKKPFELSTHHVHTQNSFASSTPCCDAERVYSAWATPDEYALVALDHAGTEKWRIALGGFTSQHGFAASPIVHDDLVIITNDQDGESFLIAVDAVTGKQRWKAQRKTIKPQNASYATPLIFTGNGQPELIVNSWAHGISSLDPKSGLVNWELPCFERRPVGSPIVVNELILGNCGEGSGNNTVVALKPGNKNGAKPEVVYKVGKTTSPYVPSLIAHGDLVFLCGDKGVFSCIDASSGKQHWSQRIGGNFSGSPVRVGDRIFAVSTDGEVVVLAASQEFKELGRNKLDEVSRSTPAIADGRMYLRTQTKLFSVGGKKS